jgi:HSP20 family protein
MRWDPLQDLVSWHERLRGTPGGSSGWAPPVDVYETGEGYVIIVELAGLSASDFDVQATDEQVTVRGERTVLAGDGRFIHVERGHGAFARTFSFPQRIEAGAVRAELREGLLTVTVPRLARQGAQRVNVQG